MTKSIRCSDAGKDCKWSATAHTEEELMSKVTEHVKEEHREIELWGVKFDALITAGELNGG